MIRDIFGFLFIASIFCLIVGLIKPTAFTSFIKNGVNRKKIAKIFGISAFIFFLLAIMFSMPLSNTFVLLFLVSIVCLFIGLVRPSTFAFLFKNNPGRKKTSAVFIFCISIFFFLTVFSSNAPVNSNNQELIKTQKSNPQEQVQNQESVTAIAQPEKLITENPAKIAKETLTPEQREVKHFLQDEIGPLMVETSKGNDDIEKAGNEWQDGTPLPYVIDAQLIFESVLKKAKAITAPANGQNVKTYFIEATQYQLEGATAIRKALEEVPINGKMAAQGIETYNKAMLSTARTNEEINKLKSESNLNL